MIISSRTPEGRPNICPVCRKLVWLDVAASEGSFADAPCPRCGCLIWFDSQGEVVRDPASAACKAEIRNWVKCFKELSKSATDPAVYYREMLTGLVSVLAAQGGAIWTPDGEGPRLRCRVATGSEVTTRLTLFEPWRRRLLDRAFSTGEASAVQPDALAQSVAQEGNPTELLLLFSPIKRKEHVVALVEIFQRPGSGPNVQRGYLRFMQQMCELAGEKSAIDGGSSQVGA